MNNRMTHDNEIIITYLRKEYTRKYMINLMTGETVTNKDPSDVERIASQMLVHVICTITLYFLRCTTCSTCTILTVTITITVPVSDISHSVDTVDTHRTTSSQTGNMFCLSTLTIC